MNITELEDGSIKELDHILNKRVCVTFKNGSKQYGILQFVGYNKLFPSWGLHCTISRMPGICIESINDIKLLENE